MTPALSFEGVSIHFPLPGGGGENPVVTDLSMSIEPGERVALLGLNGSGKTTLQRAVVGLVPFEGRISVGGVEVAPRTLDSVRAQVGVLFNVPEDQILFPRVLDDVAFGPRRQGLVREEAWERARRSLSQLGVGDLADRQVFELSHGQKLRVALAGVLVLEPSVLLLDEPTAGLDPPGLGQLVAALGEQSAALLVATHDLDFAERLCSRQLLLSEGRIAYDGESVGPVRERWGLPSGRGST
ncbi:MAG: ABC transporter ATP-binding protein [Polyangia bacterium]|jgi:energy-coupling factor transporter ATP-binding protein EcfA2|nr:ABC transporter ATP-binding protein [Polyangia bacterium]